MTNMYQDSVWAYSFHSYACSGDVKFKITEGGAKARYRCSVRPDSGFIFRAGGTLYIELMDKDTLVLTKFPIDQFVHVRDPLQDEDVSRIASGIADVTLQQLLKTRFVGAPSTLNIVRTDTVALFSALRRLLSKKAPSTKKVPKSEAVSTQDDSDFDNEIEKWTKKAEGIRVGMTYEEMIRVAGEPRIQAPYDTDEMLAGYDTYKYNYGRKWVLFKDRLVHRIK